MGVRFVQSQVQQSEKVVSGCRFLLFLSSLLKQGCHLRLDSFPPKPELLEMLVLSLPQESAEALEEVCKVGSHSLNHQANTFINSSLLCLRAEVAAPIFG